MVFKRRKNKITNVDFVKDIHNIFVENMESSYGAILNFLGFIIPSSTAFVYLIYYYNIEPGKYRNFIAFMAGTIVINIFLTWGALYVLALSYRYRYLQCSVYKIESDLNVGHYIPETFKPEPYKDPKEIVMFCYAPAILQVHLAFFFVFIIGFLLGFVFLTPWEVLKILPIAVTILLLAIILFAGMYHFPKKINIIINKMNQSGNNN